METASVWGYLHIMLFVLWLGTDIGVFVALGRTKQSGRLYEVRKGYVDLAQTLHVIPRICFALTLPVGLEFTQAVNIYPVNPGLLGSFWVIGIVWLAVIAVAARNRGTPLAKGLSYAEITFEVLAGMGFVAYGLNSLATGSPIDDGWFASKLALIGLLFWVAIAAELSFHPFVLPFAEIGDEGPTFEREEAVARALDNTQRALALMFVVLAVIAFLGEVRPV
jgi:hypothetical protein